jgi:tRNA 2-thiouridine synthesizing protein B
MRMSDIFLLTKPPGSERTKLCFKLLSRSKDARLYLCGDGVYCLLGGIGNSLTDIFENSLGEAHFCDRIFVCREDMEARGISCVNGIRICGNFYDMLIEDMMEEGCRVYSF